MGCVSPDSTDKVVSHDSMGFSSLSEILNTASQDQKTPILSFSADWCGSCREYKKTLTDQRVALSYKNAFLIDVNVDTDSLGLTERYGVTQIPTFIKLDSTGRALAKITSAEWEDNLPEYVAPVIDSLVNFNVFDRTSN